MSRHDAASWNGTRPPPAPDTHHDGVQVAAVVKQPVGRALEVVVLRLKKKKKNIQQQSRRALRRCRSSAALSALQHTVSFSACLAWSREKPMLSSMTICSSSKPPPPPAAEAAGLPPGGTNGDAKSGGQGSSNSEA